MLFIFLLAVPSLIKSGVYPFSQSLSTTSNKSPSLFILMFLQRIYLERITNFHADKIFLFSLLSLSLLPQNHSQKKDEFHNFSENHHKNIEKDSLGIRFFSPHSIQLEKKIKNHCYLKSNTIRSHNSNQ